MSTGHFFRSNAAPIANLTATSITTHAPLWTNSSLTVSNVLTVSGNLNIVSNLPTSEQGARVTFAATNPGPMLQKQNGAEADRYGISHDAFITRMYAGGDQPGQRVCALGFAESESAYADVLSANSSDCSMRVNLRLGGAKRVAWASNTVKPNMIQLYAAAPSTADTVTGVIGLGINPSTLRYNTSGTHLFSANGQSILQLKDGLQEVWRDFVCQDANLYVNNGRLNVSDILLCSVDGYYENKLCVGHATGADSTNLRETRTYGLGCEKDGLIVRVGTDTGLIRFYSNTNDIGMFAYGTIAANGVYATTGRLRIGGTGFPQWQLWISNDCAYKPASGSWTMPSDERIKANIEHANLEMCWASVKNLSLKRFRWNEHVRNMVYDQRVLGWIAQDVQTFFPKSVSVSTSDAQDADDGSKNAHDGFLVLNEDQILKTAYGALELAIHRIEKLRARLQVVQTELRQLNSEITA